MSLTASITHEWDYQAPWWLPNGHLQTIWASKVTGASWKSKPTHYVRERWTTPDSDFIDVDIQYAHHSQGPLPENSAPWLVLFHGLEGSSSSPYARAFAEIAHLLGWHFVVPHFRGCSGDINLLPRAYHSGDHQEIDWILKRLQNRSQGALRVVGISLGGNALLRWAQTAGNYASKLARSVCAICAPLDLMACGQALGQGINRLIYTRIFLKTMKPKALQKLQKYPGLFDYEKILRAQTLYEFDDIFTAPLHGFKGVEDYWRQASALPALGDIQIPALIVNARNDPFVPAGSLPRPHGLGSHICLWQPQSGGHVGFVTRKSSASVSTLPQAVAAWMN